VCLLPEKVPTETRKMLFRAFLQHQPSYPQAETAEPFVVPRADRFGSALSNHASGSIAVRPASGFLQVSLSKVLRPECHRAPSFPAEALPMKANDKGGSFATRGAPEGSEDCQLERS